MVRNLKKRSVFDLKVLVKTMVISHEHIIASLINHTLQFTHASEIASRLKEPVEKVKRALEKLEKDGWVVCENASGGDRKVKPTFESWEVYGCFEIIYPKWDSPESLQVKYGSETGKVIFCKRVIDCFYRVLKERYGEKFLEKNC